MLRLSLCFVGVMCVAHMPLGAKEIIESQRSRSASLGGAYDSKKEAFVGAQCVDGPRTEAGGSESSLNLDQAQSETALAQSMGFSVGARARYGIAEGNLSADFVSRAASSEFSVSSVYSATYLFPKERLATPALNRIGFDVNQDPERWTSTCGDSYVSEVRKGGKLFFSVRIDFSSREEKSQFEARFSLNVPAASVSAAMRQATDHLSRKTKITVAAYQFGGDVEQLSGIFPDDGSGKAAYLQCTAGDIASCATVVQNALGYATDRQRGFPSQLQDARKRATLSYDVAPYAAAGIYGKQTAILEAIIKLKRDELAKLFEKQFDLYRQLMAMKNGGVIYADADSVATALANAQLNLAAIGRASETCYETPKECQGAVDGFRPATVDPSLLVRPYLSQICERAYDGRDQGLKDAVLAVLLNEGASPREDGGRPSGCNTREPGPQYVRLGSVVDLSRKTLAEKYDFRRDIVTVSPLIAGADSLRQIFLESQRVIDIGPLALLSEMAVLNIRRNRVSDLGALGMAKYLEILLASDNQISSLRALSGLSNLKNLELNNNLIVELGELGVLPRLIKLALDNNQVQSLEPLSNFPQLSEVDARRNSLRKLSDFKPLRLDRLNVEENPLPEEEVLAFCKTSRGTTVSFSGPEGGTFKTCSAVTQ